MPLGRSCARRCRAARRSSGSRDPARSTVRHPRTIPWQAPQPVAARGPAPTPAIPRRGHRPSTPLAAARRPWTALTDRRVRGDLPARPAPELGLARSGRGRLVRRLGALAVARFGLHCVARASTTWQRADRRGRRRTMTRGLSAGRVASERVETRHRLEAGFARIVSGDGREGGEVLDGLGRRVRCHQPSCSSAAESGQSISLSSLLPDLAQETYRHGDERTLGRGSSSLEFADGPQRRRLEAELAEIEDRLERDDSRRRSSPVPGRAATRLTPAAPRSPRRVAAAGAATSCSRRSAARRRWPRRASSSPRSGPVTPRSTSTPSCRPCRTTIRRVRDVQDELRTARLLAGATHRTRKSNDANEHEVGRAAEPPDAVGEAPTDRRRSPPDADDDRGGRARSPAGDRSSCAACGESTGARQLAVLDEVTTVGLWTSQRNAGRQLELVKTRLATFLDEGGAEPMSSPPS